MSRMSRTPDDPSAGGRRTQTSPLNANLSISIAGLRRAPGSDGVTFSSVRDAIAWGAALGFQAIQLDGTWPEARARDLSRSGRRDIASILKRHGAAFSGLDLWIPPTHWLDTAHVDRAADAVLQAIELASELASLALGLTSAAPMPGAGRVVCIEFPTATPRPVLASLGAAAARHGVLIADHHWDQSPAPSTAISEAAIRTPNAIAGIAPGLDPTAVLIAKADPVTIAASLASTVTSARLCDLASTGRVHLGSPQGRLDVDAYRAALDAGGYRGPLVLDLRGLEDPLRGGEQGAALLRRAQFLPFA
ncbi:MAG: TIM barrel protein [Planctomycetota bacterium]|nr:TIM barrel protein [Planctomycetota bacterium]